MRRFALVLLAGLLVLGFSVPQAVHAKPVLATTGCVTSDSPDTPYADGYWSGSQWVYDPAGNPHLVGFDLAAYRATHSYGGQWLCERSYYVSTWTYDHTIMDSLTAHIRVWVCGNPRDDFQQVAYNDWGRAVVAYDQNRVWGQVWPGADGVQLYTNTPDGHTWLLGYANYTWTPDSPCGRQADNQITSAVNASFAPTTAFVYLNING